MGLFSDWPFKGDILGVPFQFHILVGISELLRQPVNDQVLKGAVISHYLPLKSGQSPGCCLPPVQRPCSSGCDAGRG